MNRWATEATIKEARDRLQAEVTWLRSERDIVHDALNKATEENALLRATLAVFADRGNWIEMTLDDNGRSRVWAGATREPCVIAQEALAPPEPGKASAGEAE